MITPITKKDYTDKLRRGFNLCNLIFNRCNHISCLFSNKTKKAVTLVELLLAVALMSMVILTTVNIEVALRRFYFSADKEGQLQVRLSTAMEHMVKRIKLAAGDVSNIPIDPFADSRGIKIWVDSLSSPGIRDHRIAYRHEGTNLRYCSRLNAFPSETCAVAREDIAANLLITDFSQPVSTWGLVIDYDPDPANGKINVLTITLRNRSDPNQPKSSNNPQVEFTTSLHMSTVSAN